MCVDVGTSAAKIAPLERKHDASATVVILLQIWREKYVRHYNIMGIAKAALEASVRYLANELGAMNIKMKLNVK